MPPSCPTSFVPRMLPSFIHRLLSHAIQKTRTAFRGFHWRAAFGKNSPFRRERFTGNRRKHRRRRSLPAPPLPKHAYLLFGPAARLRGRPRLQDIKGRAPGGKELFRFRRQYICGRNRRCHSVILSRCRSAKPPKRRTDKLVDW